MSEEVIRRDGVDVHVFPPSGSERAPALIFLHERYGLVKHTLDLAAKAAGDGFVGVAPDLFSRWTGDKEALRRGDVRVFLPDADVSQTLHTTIDALRAHPRVDPDKIVLVGVCQSGRYAVVLASEHAPLAGCVVLYGAAQDRDWPATPDQPRALEDMIRDADIPFLFCFGEKDHVISLDEVRRLRDAFERAKKSYRLRVWAEMPHGWLNDTMPGRYRAPEAEDAWNWITLFSREVFAGLWPADRVRSEYTSDVSPDYDFTKNVRYE